MANKDLQYNYISDSTSFKFLLVTFILLSTYFLLTYSLLTPYLLLTYSLYTPSYIEGEGKKQIS